MRISPSLLSVKPPLSIMSNPLLSPSHVPTSQTRVGLPSREGGEVKVPCLAVGTWSWGDKSVWGWKEEDFVNVEAALKGVLEEQGEVFLDSAEVYGDGESERIIKRLRDGLSEEERGRVLVATKWLPLPSFRNPFLFSCGIVSGLRGSLKRLGMEQVELYQIHGPIGYHSWETQGRELAECVKLGLAKTVGVSNFSTSELIKMHAILASYGVPLASNQIEFNLLRQSPLKNGLMEEMKKRGVVCLAYSPLAQGRLSGKYSAENPPPSGRRFSNLPMSQIDPLVNEMKKIAETRNVPVSAIAINWVLSKGAIPLGGAKNAHQAKQNGQALGFRLSEEEVLRLEALGAEGKTSFWQHG
ncbi:NADP-dependent oxidoreductase domain-containing protein [Mrakia frigida]|uniref:aldo/keto reductase n=1 Tax=Mrakia frigida TaxID=29902 RepID=UPI003FCBF738